jgi:phage gp36-like protein
MAYATTTDLAQVGVNADALAGIDNASLTAALASASAVADGYLTSRYVLPLIAPYPADLVQHVCGLAAYFAIKARGFDPNANPTIRFGYEDAMSWLRDISRNLVHPQVTESARPAGSVEPIIISRPRRGW